MCKGISVCLSPLHPFRRGPSWEDSASKDLSPHPGEGDGERVGQWVRGREAGGRHPPNTEGTGLSQGSPQGDASAKWLSLTLSQSLSENRAPAGRGSRLCSVWGGDSPKWSRLCFFLILRERLCPHWPILQMRKPRFRIVKC